MKLDDELRTFLQQRQIARVTTIGLDGYPHTVPIWYMLDGDDILISTDPESRKVKNVRANSKGAVSIGGDPVDDHASYAVGYLFQGDWALEGEPGFNRIKEIARRYWDDPERVEREVSNWGPHQELRFTIKNVVQVMA